MYRQILSIMIKNIQKKNDEVIPFAVREAQMRKLKEHGLEKVYLHLDGWETQDMITSIRIICLLVRKPVDGKECDHCRNV